MKKFASLRISRGYPYPFGATTADGGINFALASEEATHVTLCFFKAGTADPEVEIPLSQETHKTGHVWHVHIKGLSSEMLYAYRIASAFSTAHGALHTPIADPYAKAMGTGNHWLGHVPAAGIAAAPYLPLAELPQSDVFDWENDTPPGLKKSDLVIYEMHVRGFTQHSSSQVAHPGSFLGVIEKIPHFLSLGVNAIELLPVQEFDEAEFFRLHPHTKKPYCNFWGYSTVCFFAPMQRYAANSAAGSALVEFKTMVKELHRHGIEVILDVVFNHTAEGNAHGPILSFKGIDNHIYYLLHGHGAYSNFTGCGNTINGNHPRAMELIIDCLRYWTTEMHVDGFRFDLASALTRNAHGIPLARAPLIKAITTDPVLAGVKLIAEPWDAAGLYQVGGFAPESTRWSEWNDKYRDGMRRYIKGTPGSKGEFATRLCGSEDLYKPRSPLSSLNFITAHDGFTLADLVSYNEKHNLTNKEHNRDGSNNNESWNCGIEGPTDNQAISQLRAQQMRNFHLALMLSQGIPMLLMGDEYGHTKNGNNNTWCHDTAVNWFLWDKLEENPDFFRFYRMLIDLRHRHPMLRRSAFLTHADIEWHGLEPLKPDWNGTDLTLAFTLKDPANQHDLFAAFNPQHQAKTVTLPLPPEAKQWHLLVNTAAEPPNDISDEDQSMALADNSWQLPAHSAILLKALPVNEY